MGWSVMDKKYAGQYIWILGASSGIGRALAIDLAKRGAVLCVSARSQDKLDMLLNELDGDGHIAIGADAGCFESLEKVANTIEQKFPKLDSAIFMAALYSAHDGSQKPLSFIHNMIRVNFIGAYNMLYAVQGAFLNQGYGQYVICASVAGYRGLPTGQPYCATKAALINLAESLRLDLSPQNIDVKVINPGFVRTPLTDKNDFFMPMMIEAEEAASVIANDMLRKSVFEIHFPKRFTFLMKIIRMLPRFIYFPLARRLR